jgi:hypothetical protein
MPVQFPPGTALILGQVETDRAVAKSDGSFHTLGDHLARLHELCCDHPKVLFKAHPYVQDRNKPPCRETIRKLPAIQMIDGNFYHLLCQPEIVRIVALNSSGLIEAPYFGKTAEALIPFLYDFGEAPPQGKGWPGAAMPQRGSWIEPWFWQSVLAGDAHAPEAATARGPANRLRRTMNADWGYSYIERVIS